VKTLPEIAWRESGSWVGELAQPRAMPELDVGHQCVSPDDCGRFVCIWCRRCMPWCFGSTGENELQSALCDDCALEEEEGP